MFGVHQPQINVRHLLIHLCVHVVVDLGMVEGRIAVETYFICITCSVSRAEDLTSDLVLNEFEVQSIHGDR